MKFFLGLYTAISLTSIQALEPLNIPMNQNHPVTMDIDHIFDEFGNINVCNVYGNNQNMVIDSPLHIEHYFEQRNGRIIRNERLVNGVPVNVAPQNGNIPQNPIANPKVINNQAKSDLRRHKAEQRRLARAQRVAKKAEIKAQKANKRAIARAKKIAAKAKKVQQKAAAKQNRGR